MKVLAINGSPRIDGNTSLALNEIKKVLRPSCAVTDTWNFSTIPQNKSIC